jgi:hypothetical protein
MMHLYPLQRSLCLVHQCGHDAHHSSLVPGVPLESRGLALTLVNSDSPLEQLRVFPPCRSLPLIYRPVVDIPIVLIEQLNYQLTYQSFTHLVKLLHLR